MKSTGEVLGIDNCYEKALIKAFMASGYDFPQKGDVVVSIKEKNREECIPALQKLQELGFVLKMDKNDKDYFSEKGISADYIDKNNIQNIISEIKSGNIKLIFNVPEKEGTQNSPDFQLRALTGLYKIPCFTCLDTIREYLKAMEYKRKFPVLDYKTIEEYMK